MQANKSKGTKKDNRECVVYARIPKDIYKWADDARKDNGQTWQGFVICLIKAHRTMTEEKK